MTVTCIIPAYNEGPRIARVLRVVTGHPLIAQVIVVDDGSTDDTVAQVGTRPGVTLIRMPRNGGKTRALAAGIAQATGIHLLLVDSDLIGLTPDDLTALLTPVLDGRADMAISLRRNAPRPWHWIGLDYISGERVFPRDMVAGHRAALDRLPRFGFEVWLNARALRAGTRLAVVPWPRVDSPTKARKSGWLRGAISDAAMIRDLTRAVGPLALLGQITGLRKLRIAPPSPGKPSVAHRLLHRRNLGL